MDWIDRDGMDGTTMLQSDDEIYAVFTLSFLKKSNHFNFVNNFRKSGPIFNFFHC